MAKIMKTDKERVKEMFKAFRKNGFIARQNRWLDTFSEDELKQKICLCTRPSSREMNEGRYTQDDMLNTELIIEWDLSVDNLNKVISIIREFEFEVDLPENLNKCIVVKPTKRCLNEIDYLKYSYHTLINSKEAMNNKYVKEFIEYSFRQATMRTMSCAYAMLRYKEVAKYIVGIENEELWNKELNKYN